MLIVARAKMTNISRKSVDLMKNPENLRTSTPHPANIILLLLDMDLLQNITHLQVPNITATEKVHRAVLRKNRLQRINTVTLIMIRNVGGKIVGREIHIQREQGSNFTQIFETFSLCYFYYHL